MEIFKCCICEKIFSGIKGLSRHVGNSHKNIMSQELYFNQFVKKVGDPDGKCLWCGTNLDFIGIGQGYKKFCYNKECNVKWYNNNSDRMKKFKNSFNETHKNKDVTWTQIGYWLKKGFSEEESKKKIEDKKEEIKFTLKNCIKWYGEFDGPIKFKERQEKWIKTMRTKSSEEISRINRLKVYSDFFQSKAELELIKILNLESCFVIPDGDSGYVFDMRKNNKLIEYNGDFWHCNPKIYERNYFNKRLKMFSWQKWEKDEIKSNYAKEKGYEILIIWEDDFKKDKENVIKKCVEFLNG
jgi:uncharacterized C2H2 Zn-finger protein